VLYIKTLTIRKDFLLFQYPRQYRTRPPIMARNSRSKGQAGAWHSQWERQAPAWQGGWRRYCLFV